MLRDPATRAGLALLVPAWLWVRTLWTATSERAATPWRMAAAWFTLSSLTSACVAFLGSHTLLGGGRQAVAIHLHALLVGFVTGSLAVLVGLHNRPETAIRYHHGALAAMLAGLLGLQLGALRPGMWLAVGGAVVCGAQVWCGWRPPFVGLRRSVRLQPAQRTLTIR